MSYKTSTKPSENFGVRIIHQNIPYRAKMAGHVLHDNTEKADGKS